MRERITFVHRADDAFRPEQFQLEHDVLHVEALKGAREDQLTFSLSELPQEVCANFLSKRTRLTECKAMASAEAVPRAPFTMGIGQAI